MHSYPYKTVCQEATGHRSAIGYVPVLQCNHSVIIASTRFPNKDIRVGGTSEYVAASRGQEDFASAPY